jgi:hypothetical protein
MSAHSTVAKAASGLSLARRTLGGVRGGHAAGFLQQAIANQARVLVLRPLTGAGTFDPVASGRSCKGRSGAQGWPDFGRRNRCS